MSNNLSLKFIAAIIAVVGLLVFGYFKYQHKNKGVVVTIYPDYVDAKTKPTESGGIVSNVTENTIYERLQSKNKASKTTKTVNILPEPEQPININNTDNGINSGALQVANEVNAQDNQDDAGDIFDRVIAGNVPKQDKMQENRTAQQSRDELATLLSSMEGSGVKQEKLTGQDNKVMTGSSDHNISDVSNANEESLVDVDDELKDETIEQKKTIAKSQDLQDIAKDELKVVKVTGSTNKLESLDKGSAGSYKIQLASVKSEAEGAQEFDRIKRKHLKILANTTMTVKKMYHDNGKVFYLVMAGNYNNSGQAKAVCKKLSQRGQNCIVEVPKSVRP